MNKLARTPLPDPTNIAAKILYDGIQRMELEEDSARATYLSINTNGSSQGVIIQGDTEQQPTAIKSGTRTRTGKRKPMSEAAKRKLSIGAKERYAAQRAEHNTQGGKAGKRGTRVMSAAG